jgi:hypothetical protein
VIPGDVTDGLPPSWFPVMVPRHAPRSWPRLMRASPSWWLAGVAVMVARGFCASNRELSAALNRRWWWGPGGDGPARSMEYLAIGARSGPASCVEASAAVSTSEAAARLAGVSIGGEKTAGRRVERHGPRHLREGLGTRSSPMTALAPAIRDRDREQTGGGGRGNFHGKRGSWRRALPQGLAKLRGLLGKRLSNLQSVAIESKPRLQSDVWWLWSDGWRSRSVKGRSTGFPPGGSAKSGDCLADSRNQGVADATPCR